MPYADDKKLFQQLAVANNRREVEKYLAIRDCFSNEYRFRIPAVLLPWDDITAEELNQLADMYIEKDTVEETGNDMMPLRAVKAVVRNISALCNSKVWRTRLW